MKQEIKEQNPTEEIQLALGDILSQGSNYLHLRIGEEVEIEIKSIKMKIEENSPFNLSKQNYHYAIETIDNKTLTVSAWTLWQAISEKIRIEERIEGLKLKIEHPKSGEYKVSIIEDEELIQ